MAKVSIVLPTYNGGKYICEAIESIINQTYTNWELIIVNDCSTDSTAELINIYAQKDSRIKIITNECNQKLPESLNIGFAVANGDYYTWTSDDNLYKPKAIETMVNLLENNDADLVSLNIDIIDESGNFIKTLTELTGKRNIKNLASGNNISACFMYTKEIAQKVGKYNKEMFYAEDYDYWCRIALTGNILYCDDLNLYSYRKHSKSLSATKLDMIENKISSVRDRYALKIMSKMNMSDLEKINKILDIYYVEEKKNPNWLIEGKKINKILFILYKKCFFLKKYIKKLLWIKLQ